MKKIILSITAFVLIAFTIASCGSKNDPKEVALNYLNALKSLDYEGAKKFSTPESGKILDMLSSFSSMMTDSMKEQAKKIKIEIKEAKEDGDKCTVKFVSSDKPEAEEVLKMVKKDGKWLVNMDKNDMQGPSGGIEESGAPPVGGDSTMVEEPMTGKDSVKVDAAH
jgi:PDZ domain-containing secreted protein